MMDKKRRTPPAKSSGFGARLRAARVRAHLTLAEAAHPHYTRQYLSAVENERVQPSLKAIEFFAARVGATIAELSEGSPEVLQLLGEVRAQAEREARQQIIAQLSDLETTVHRLLHVRWEFLARLYLGAITTLKTAGHADRLPLAAHDFRELMEKYPRNRTVEASHPGESLTDRIQRLGLAWAEAQRGSQCLVDGVWQGSVDAPLATYLAEATAHFDWVASNRQSPRDGMQLLLTQTIGARLPSQVEPTMDAWAETQKFFVNVAHHTWSTTEEAFDRQKTSLERFIVRNDAPGVRTIETISGLDELIAEGERNADQ